MINSIYTINSIYMIYTKYTKYMKNTIDRRDRLTVACGLPLILQFALGIYAVAGSPVTK